LREYGELTHSMMPNLPPGNYDIDISKLPSSLQRYINYMVDQRVQQENQAARLVCTPNNPTDSLPFGGQELRAAPPTKSLALDFDTLTLQ
jgi:hypothetical protein